MRIPVRTLRISADAMVSLGLLERDGERYRNTAVTAAYLAGAVGPDSDRRCALDWISYPTWMNLEEAVRRGEGQTHFGRFTEEDQQIFSAGERRSLREWPPRSQRSRFQPHRQVFDVGGGTGSFLLPSLRRYPALQATLFELPGACTVARQRLADKPERDRVCSS